MSAGIELLSTSLASAVTAVYFLVVAFPHYHGKQCSLTISIRRRM